MLVSLEIKDATVKERALAFIFHFVLVGVKMSNNGKRWRCDWRLWTWNAAQFKNDWQFKTVARWYVVRSSNFLSINVVHVHVLQKTFILHRNHTKSRHRIPSNIVLTSCQHQTHIHPKLMQQTQSSSSQSLSQFFFYYFAKRMNVRCKTIMIDARSTGWL